MAKVQKVTAFRLSEIDSMSGIYPQEAMFRARKLQATGTYHGKAGHGMKILKEYNKSTLVTMSQNGSENTIASM